MQKISIKGVLIGSIIDYVLRQVFFVLPVVYVAIKIGLHNDTPANIAKTAFAAIEDSLTLHYLQFAGGLLATVIAGYVAARVAKKNELLNGFLAALPCTALAMYRWSSGADEQTLSATALQITASLMCALFGGFLAMARNRPTH